MKKKYRMYLILGVFIVTFVMLFMTFSKEITLSEDRKSKEITLSEDRKSDKKEIIKDNEKDEKKEIIFKTSEKSYFDDALFIGDSRTVGLCEYGDLDNADYFSSTGMSIYKLWKEVVSVKNVGRVSLQQLLEVKSYKKIYIMLGINELGYKTETTIEKYRETISALIDSQPDAIIYVCANLHVTKERSLKDELINNRNIDDFNTRLNTLTDNESIYYIDIKEKFDDGSGNLNSDYSNDNVHVLAKYYKDWSNWLCDNTIKP